jgi:MacB-like periplasmic core domain
MTKVFTWSRLTHLCVSCSIAASATAQTIKPGSVVEPSTQREDVLIVRELYGPSRTPSGTISATAGVEIRRQLASLATLALISPVGSTSLYTDERATRELALPAVEVSPEATRLLGLKPEVGRLFSDTDAARADRVAVLVYGAWRSYFGSAKDITSKQGWLMIKGQKATARVIGVLPLGVLQGIPEIDPKAEALILSTDRLDAAKPGERWFAPVIRLNRGVSAADVQRVLDKVAEKMRAANPKIDVAYRLETLRAPGSGRLSFDAALMKEPR